ncbi:aldehyde reductase [Alteromonas sp. MMG017]|uniref:SDR family oxidoreductase n=1 Tax=Alteromonas sp. MMG017 TaxID=2822692 RepID=UPI001B39FFB0|nr:aldehyde reductase [Alteromonas sp. MMG017]MBQ4830453.1 aldehyde reductase [Alteromonas sp. MMG017]
MKNKEKVLVTGGTGFVGIHIILNLLKRGYTVKTTIRNLNKKYGIIEILENEGATDLDAISFIEADLTDDKNWSKAVKDCQYVLHVASPFPAKDPENPDELLIPAIEGTLRVLKHARDANVKRVVMTSSFATIGYSNKESNYVFTEKDWTNPEDENTTYIRSKTLAERAAWDFITSEGGNLEFTVINPVGIFGPILGKNLSSSVQLVEQLLNKKIPAVPNVHFGIVDVRDVADIHIKAMSNEKAKGERFLLTGDSSISLPEIAQILHSHENKFSTQVTTKVLPNWLVKLLSIFKPELKNVASQVGKIKILSNKKVKNTFNWTPINKEKIIKDTAESLIEYGIIKKH